MNATATAAYLAALRAGNGRVQRLPARFTPASIDAAYGAQAELVDVLLGERGGALAGYKIALTSAVAQSLVGVREPVFGRLLSTGVLASGATLAAGSFGTRIVEVEFGFRIGRDVPALARGHDADSVADYVAAVLPSIEIVDHHFGGLDQISVEALIADNAIHGVWVHGAATTDLQGLNLASHRTALSVNGEPVLEGAGDRSLGGPFNALAWLANALTGQGLTLRAGDYVTTGLTTDGIVEAAPGDRLLADFGALGEVHLAFD